MIMLSSIVFVIVNRIWQLFNWLCWKNVSFILQVLPSPRFACLNCIYLEVIARTQMLPNINFLSTRQSPTPYATPFSITMDWGFYFLLHQNRVKSWTKFKSSNSNSWTFDTNRNPWQFSGAWHWLGAQRVSHQLVQEYLHSFWPGTCRA